MTGSAEDGNGTPRRLAAVLSRAAVAALGVTEGRVAGVYLPSATPRVLRLSVLAGLPGPLFRPWWRLHTDRRFPVADVYRLGVQVVLPNITQAMRRYPQFTAGLPLPIGAMFVPVADASRTYGVLTVLRPSSSDATEVLPERDRLTLVADSLAADLRLLEADGTQLTWDEEPLCVRPPTAAPGSRPAGRFRWHPASDTVVADEGMHGLLGTSDAAPPDGVRSLAEAVAPHDAHRLVQALRETSRGSPTGPPVQVRSPDGALRLVASWAETADHARADSAPADGHPVVGVVLETGSVAEAAADRLPQGVFCLDRLGLVVYANPRAAELFGLARADLVGRPLWEGVPWLAQPACEDQLRAALLSPDPVRFHVRRPHPRGPEQHAVDWLTLSVHPGPDLLICNVVPSGRVEEAPPAPAPERGEAARTAATGGPGTEAPLAGATSMNPAYRPIVLAIALSEAVTARQVSAVVVQELLPAFGGNRLAIYLLHDRHLHLAWETGFPKGFLAPFEGVGLDAHLPGVETLTTGQPLFFDSMEQVAAAYPGIAMDAREGARAFLPLIASGRPVGSCILGFDRPRSFSTEERTVLTALAGLIAHAMEKAQRYETEAALARGLQRALLPRQLPTHPLVETAGRYLPGTQGMDVGGDWYDVVEAGDGLALVIGDVQGHGVQAAATMGQLRSAVRAFALDDRSPDEVLDGTNRLLVDLDPGQFATCCYVRLDPVSGLALLARAGHPPPLLRRPDGRTRVVDIPGGVVLGVDPQAQYPVAELRLAPGALLALYTDGLVERPGADIDEGIAALRVALARAGAPVTRPGGRSLATVADRLTTSARHSADRPDDIALLLAARRTGPAR
ncbi:SpoIIE family protein phosphatase [Streptomyces sp. B93]|uniref:SpoIIE family protein phosphatase n=1 Tax=Streptomyces sp. B93 TaxID=2824875 RepID=UPI001B36ECE4|nr:SpoIIE family protein phosphatase [Streptomyces sp. B93]MBQ1093189.1 SpoIIE family protein phosphatase [Streptomyces sp. B93]